MKAFELQAVGFRERSLENLFEDTLYTSSFFNQPLPVRGICFAAGDESMDIARKFARGWLGSGAISLHMETMTEKEWDGFLKNDTLRPGFRAPKHSGAILQRELTVSPVS